MPSGLRQRILREFERWQLVGRQIHDLEARADATDPRPRNAQGEQGAAACSSSRGSARTAAWLLVREFFGWRGIRNRRELASLAGSDADAVRQRGRRSRAGDQQGGQSAGAVDDDRAGLGLAEVPARRAS